MNRKKGIFKSTEASGLIPGPSVSEGIVTAKLGTD